MQSNSKQIKISQKKKVVEYFSSPRFNKVIPLIAQSTEAGSVCFLNPESLELELVPGSLLINPEAFYASSGSTSGQEPFQHLLWHNCLMFEPIPEKELYRMIEGFMQYLTGQAVCDKLTRLMMKRKPYSKINAFMIKSSHSDFWMRYKTQYVETLIKDKLVLLLNDNDGVCDEGKAFF